MKANISIATVASTFGTLASPNAKAARHNIQRQYRATKLLASYTQHRIVPFSFTCIRYLSSKGYHVLAAENGVAAKRFTNLRVLAEQIRLSLAHAGEHAEG